MSGVLVTGASGFIGLPVAERLARSGKEVHALSTRVGTPEIPGVRWHCLDLFDHVAVEEMMEQLAPKRLVHCAWCMQPGYVWRAPENVVWVESSLRLLRSFVRHGGRRLVALGTCAEYDWSMVDGPLGESSSTMAPRTLYGVAKDALRRVAGAYAEQEGIELVWARPFFVYGPREARARLVPSVARSLLASQAIATTSGKQVRDFMHVEDVAAAALALLDGSATGVVNVASGTGVALGEVVDRLAQLIGRPELIRRGCLPDRPGEPQSLVADVSRLRDEVGFRPRWALAEGLADTVRWWEEHRD